MTNYSFKQQTHQKSTLKGAQSFDPDPPDPGGPLPYEYLMRYSPSELLKILEERKKIAFAKSQRRPTAPRHHSVMTLSQPPLATTTTTRSRIHGSSQSFHSSRATGPSQLATQPLLQEEWISECTGQHTRTTDNDYTTNRRRSSRHTVEPPAEPHCDRERDREHKRRFPRTENDLPEHTSGRTRARQPRDVEHVRKRVRFVLDEGEGMGMVNIEFKYINSTYYKSQQARKPEPAPPQSHSTKSTQNEPMTVRSVCANAREPNEAHVRPSAPLVVAPAPPVADSTQNEPKSAHSIQSNSHKPTRARTAPPVQPNVRICERIRVQVDLARSTIEKSHGGDSSPPHHEHKHVRFTTGEGGRNGAQGKYGLPPRTSNHHEKRDACNCERLPPPFHPPKDEPTQVRHHSKSTEPHSTVVQSTTLTCQSRKRECEDLSDHSPRPVKVTRRLTPRIPLITIPNPNWVGKHGHEDNRDHNH